MRVVPHGKMLSIFYSFLVVYTHCILTHGISFQQAKTIFNDKFLPRQDDRFDYGEIREISLGLIEGTTVILVVHTHRKEKIRIISARKANKQEREIYYEFTGKET